MSMSAADRSTSRAPGAPDAVDTHRRAVERHRDSVRIKGDRRHADRREHPAPVRVRAEYRRLDQAVAGDHPRGGQSVVLGGGSRHRDGDALGDALGVGLQLSAQVVADPQHSLVEIGLRRGDPAGTRRQQQHGVVRRTAAVDVEPVERAGGWRGAVPGRVLPARRQRRW